MIEITYDSEKGFQTKHTIEDETIVAAAIETIESFKKYCENQIEFYKREIRRLEKENKELKKELEELEELEDFKFMYDNLCK